MDVSSLSTTPRACLSSSSTESTPLKRGELPSGHHGFLSFSWIRRNANAQPVFGKTRSLVQNKTSLKVLCSQRREIPVVEARCMDEVYDALAQRLLPTSALASNVNVKHIVGLAGPPGAGKSTLAAEVVRRINKIWPQKASSFDSQDPKEAHARRGAPWTFNPLLLLNCLKNLRNQGSVYAPSFDHGVGDPVEDDILVGLQHKVVIVDGNYLFLDGGVWKDVSSMFDEKW
ncbi:hypothetical protein CISIN_1g0213621mg [Citrus sinensis]|nr:hypothetical protein CISIN_1g0213621mg [Citrus sinensis]